MKPTIIVENHSAEAEVQVLLFTASQIKQGFYQNYGFLLDVADAGNNQKHSVLITKPQFEYLRSEFDWNVIDDVVVSSWPVVSPNTYIPEFKRLCSYQNPVPETVVSEIHTVEAEFYKIIEVFNPEALHTKIVVRSSRIGAIASFNMQKEINTLFTNVRHDASLSDFLYCIVNGLLEIETGEQQGWLVRQEVMRLLCKNPRIGSLVSKDDLVYRHLQKHEHRVEDTKRSDEYYAALGFPVGSVLVKAGTSFYVQQSKEPLHLSSSEYALLSELYERKGQVATYEQLAHAVWGEGFYSLEALAKIVERIRKKLKEAGMKKSSILTVRKRGFKLLNS